MPRIYVLLGVLTAGEVYLLVGAVSRHDTGATVGWALGTTLAVVMMLAPLVIGGLMRRVRPMSRRGRHAER